MFIPTTTVWGFIWTFCLHSITNGQRPKVTVPILAPNVLKYKSTITTAVSSITRSRTSFFTLKRKYDIKVEYLPLNNQSPSEILQLFNDTILQGGINSVIYLQIGGETSVSSTDYVTTVLEDLGLPVLSWDPKYSGALEKIKDQKVLQFAPTVYHQAKAMLQLMEFFNWTHFTIVSSTHTNHFDFISAVKDLVNEKNEQAKKHIPIKPEFKLLETIVCDIGEGKDSNVYQPLMRKCLKQKVPRENRIFLMHTETKYAKELMEAATRIGLTTKDYQWILTTSAMGLVTYLADNAYPLGVLGLTHEEEYPPPRTVEIIKDAISDSVRVWSTAMLKLSSRTSLNLFPDLNNSSRWEDGQEVYNEMLKIRLKDRTSSVEFTENGLNQYTSLNILNTQEKAERTRVTKKWVKVGDWFPKRIGSEIKPSIELNSITWPGNQPFPPLGRPARRFFNIATLNEAPYVMYRPTDALTGKCNYPATKCRVVYNATEHGNDTTYENGTVVNCCTGLSIDLLLVLSDKMKFDFNLFEVPDRTFGIQDVVTGEWNGLIELLMNGEADMVVTSMQITPRRSEAAMFSMPFLETGTTIIVSLTKGAISATAVLEPYDYPAWCLILVFSVHSIGASIFIFEWLSPAGLDQGKTPMREHKFSLFRSFWLIWAMLFGAAVSADNPRGVSSRFLGNVWALFALVFLASYTANLAAFMITKESYYDLSGIQDWRLTNPYKHKPRPFKFATVPNGSTEENLRETRPGMYKYMYQYMQPSVPEAIAALKRQDINAFIYDATPLEYQVGIDPDCDLRTVGQSYAMTGYGIGFPLETDTDLVTEVNNIILDLQEDGELERLRKFWLAGACHSKLNQKRSSDELGILNFTSAFILLAAGIVLGGLLLILEHLYFRFGRKCLKEYDKCGCCALVSLSLGKSLTFEQTIMEAIDLHKKHKCKDPLCETQLWKAKHELDLALLKIQKLSREIGAIKQAPALKYKLESIGHQDSKVQDETIDSKPKVTETSNGDMRKRRQDPTLRRSPSYNNAIGGDSNLTKDNQSANNTASNGDYLTKESPSSRNEAHAFGEGEV